MPITKQLLKELRAEVNAALAPLGAKYGITLTAGNATYLTESFTIKLEGSVIGAASPEETLYNKNVAFLRLPPLGTEFTLRRDKYIIKGMKPRGMNNILIERVKDAKGFVCPHTSLPRTKAAPTLTLDAFVVAVNDLQKAEVEKINTPPGQIFGAAYHPYPKTMLAHDHADGLTPAEVLENIAAEAEAELRAEARAS